MAVLKEDSLPFRPYARLMNIIGDQLITDKKVAVIEIIKNCYDADAKSVKVRFCNTSNVGFVNLPQDQQAYIEIEDNGCGMSLDTVENVWLRPATPNKSEKKHRKENHTPLGRIIQGEKGIGRFAVHKLGEKIVLFTKNAGADEVKVVMDFREFDPDTNEPNLFRRQERSYKLLEEVNNKLYVNRPPERVFGSSGTIIRIYNVRELWTRADFADLYKNIQRLIPPVDKNASALGVSTVGDFNVELFVDDKRYVNEEVMTFSDVIERAQFTMIGKISDKGVLDFKYISAIPRRVVEKRIDLLDLQSLAENGYSGLYGLKWFREDNSYRTPGCGGFGFTFYAFDLKRPDRARLDKALETFIKENFVFVLRDGVRVYPYGEKGIDWLSLDKLRSTYRAGNFVSYNDLTGFIYITQEGNPDLKDASNRQGIVNTQGKFDDFTNLVTAATEIFNAEIKVDKLKADLQQKASFQKSKSTLSASFEEVRIALEKAGDTKVLSVANKFVKTYQDHLELLSSRMKTVEDLAGLGMAVEKSSHDSLRLLSLMRKNIRNFRAKRSLYNQKEEDTFLNELDEGIGIVYEDLQIIQPLFKINRSSVKQISISSAISKVLRYFRTDIDEKIQTQIVTKKDDLCVKSNLGLILQVLINIVDNSIYWLQASQRKSPKLEFYVDSESDCLIVADNGCGVRGDVAPLLFQEFFSMKSNGRGLGLYIARELLSRIGAEISLIEDEGSKQLPGANFLIKFSREGNE